MLKALEMIVDFRRNPPALPPHTIMNSTVTGVEPFRFLGTTVSQDLKWDNHIESLVKKSTELQMLQSRGLHWVWAQIPRGRAVLLGRAGVGGQKI